MDPSQSPGFKQHNPLNMRPLGGGVLWHGQTGSANGFCVFSDPRWCFRAWLIEARNYRLTWNCQCVMDYIRHYAPPEDDNDPVAYTAAVEKFMRLGTGEEFDLDERALDFIKGQMCEEIGGAPYPDAMILEGFSWVSNR